MRDEHERAYLRAIFQTPAAYNGTIGPEHFQDTRNSLIFGAIKRLIAEGEVIDRVTVANELLRKGNANFEAAGGLSYLVELTEPETAGGSGQTPRRN